MAWGADLGQIQGEHSGWRAAWSQRGGGPEAKLVCNEISEKCTKRQKKYTHAKYSNAWSRSFLISNNSNAVSVKLVGSMLKGDSASWDDPIDLGGNGESASDTGPTINEGHMIESDFSRCRVNSRPDPGELSDSTDDNGEATLFAKCSGDPVRDICCLRRRERDIVDNPVYSSAEDTGDDKPGDGT
jgi:hypothetical protein